MSLWTAWLHVNCWISLGSRTLENSSWSPLNPSQLLAGPVGVRKLFPVPPLAEKLKNMEFSVVKLSAKQFPESMVVLNYLHVSNIFNSFFFFNCFHHKNAVSLGKGPSPWPATFQVSFIIQTGLFGLQKILCLGMLLDCKIWVILFCILFMFTCIFLYFPEN